MSVLQIGEHHVEFLFYELARKPHYIVEFSLYFFYYKGAVFLGGISPCFV